MRNLIIGCFFYALFALIPLIFVSYLSYINYLFLFEISINQFNIYYPNFGLLLYLLTKSLLTTYSIFIAVFFKHISLLKRKSFYLLILFSVFLLLSNLIFSIKILSYSIAIFFLLLFVFEFKHEIQLFYKKVNNITSNNREFYFLLIIVFIVLVIYGVYQRLYIGYYYDNMQFNDNATRLFVSQIWFDYYLKYGDLLRKLVPEPSFGPVHYYFTGIVFGISNSINFLKLAHSIVGVLSAIFIWKISKLAFNREVAIVSTVGYLFYNASIYISAQIMSEPLFIFSILASIYYFLKFMHNKKYINLYIYLFFISMASLIRFEALGSMILFLFSSIIVFNHFNIKTNLILLSCFIVPIIYSVIVFEQGYGLFFWLKDSDYQVSEGVNYFGKNWSNFLVYQQSLVPFSILLSIFTIIFFEKTKSIIFILFFSLVSFLPFVYKSLQFTLTADSRYLIYYEVLFLITASYAIILISKNIFFSKPLYLALSLFFVYSMTSFSSKIKETNSFKTEFYELDEYIKNLESAEIILDLDTLNIFNEIHLVARNRLPLLLNYDEPFLKRYLDLEPLKKFDLAEKPIKSVRFLTSHRNLNIDESFIFQGDKNPIPILKTIIKKHEYATIILFKNGILNSIFCFKNDYEWWEGLSFRKVFDNGEYLVYQKVMN